MLHGRSRVRWSLAAAAVAAGAFLGNVSIDSGQVGLVSTATAGEFDPWIQICGPGFECWASDGNYYGKNYRGWFLKVLGCQIDWGSDLKDQGRRDGFFRCVWDKAGKLVAEGGKKWNEAVEAMKKVGSSAAKMFDDWIYDWVGSKIGCSRAESSVGNLGGLLACAQRAATNKWNEAVEAMKKVGSAAAGVFDDILKTWIGDRIGCTVKLSDLGAAYTCISGKIGSAVSGGLATIVNGVKTLMGDSKFTDALKCAVPGGEYMVKGSPATGMLDGVIGLFTNPGETLKKWFNFDNIKKAIGDKFNEITTRAGTMTKDVLAHLKHAAGVFGALMRDPNDRRAREYVKEPLRRALYSAWDGVSDLLKQIPGMFCPITMAEGFRIRNLLIEGLAGGVVDLVANVWGGAKAVLDGLISKAKDIADGAGARLKELFTQFIEGKLPKPIADALPPWLTDVPALIRRTVAQIAGPSKEMLAKIATVAGDVKKGVTSGLASLKQSVASLPKLGNPGAAFTLAVKAGVQMLKEWGRGLIETELGKWLEKGLATVSSLTGAVTSGIDAVCGLVPFVGAAICASTVSMALRLVWDWLGLPEFKKMGTETLVRMVNDVADWVGSQIDKALGKTARFFGARLGGLTSILGGLVDTVRNFVNAHILPIVNGALGMNELLSQIK